MDKNQLVEIYKTEAEKYNKTRGIHWKMNIAVWTVLIIVIYVKSENKFHIKYPVIEWVSAFGLLLLHFSFVKKIHGSLKRSLTRMHNMASAIIKDEEKSYEWTDFDKKVVMNSGGWEYLQIWITIFLIIIYFVVRYSVPLK